MEENAGDSSWCVVEVDADGRVTGWNDAAARLFGVEAFRALGRSAGELFASASDRAWLAWAVAERARGSDPCGRHACHARRADGGEFPADVVVAAAGKAEPRPLLVLVRELAHEFRRDDEPCPPSQRDKLTGFPDRVWLLGRLALATRQAARAGARFAVLHVDLDRFKVINDTLGHAAGEEVLRAVARRLRAAVRASDTVGRLGGDEFLILLHGVARAADGVHIAETVRAALREPLSVRGRQLRVTASIGISAYPSDGATAETLRRKADEAKSVAKAAGGNRVQPWRAKLRCRARHRLDLECDLHRALGAGEMELHYQPLLDAAAGRPCGVEALLRWRHPARGLLMPGQFVSIAETSGLIVPIGAWVLREATRRVRSWTQRAPLVVAVNLAPQQLQDSRVVAEIRSALRESGLPGALLEVEITESAAMQDLAATKRVLREIRRLGVRVALDDFGTGYSSLGYLQTFPVDTLKIDRTFVRGLPSDPDSVAIVRAIVGMAHALRLCVVAEGVEREEQAAALAECGCDRIQGFAYARPLPAAECEAFLRGAGPG